MLDYRPFQREFLRNATRADIAIAALCLPRGNGKSTLAADLVRRIMSPDDDLFRPGTESVLVAGSMTQARIVFKLAKAMLGADGYRYNDSPTKINIKHLASDTDMRIIASNGHMAMGLVNCPWAICDEPGSWNVNSGGLVWAALTTARMKPQSPLKILIVGTLSPRATHPGHWYFDLIDDGTKGDTYVMSLRGDPTKWDNWHEIRRVNPLVTAFPDTRKKLLLMRDEARADARKRSEFMSYNMNCPTGDETTDVVPIADWERALARPVAERDGRPFVGVDIGRNRSWSAATAIYPNGRIEAVAVAPGIPSIREQEKRDRVPAGVYQKLVDSGQLTVADDLRVVPPSQLMDRVRDEWGKPARTVMDRFRHDEVLDCTQGLKMEVRIPQWSYAAHDIRALRRGCSDGPYSVAPESRLLLTASLRVAMVENDNSGSFRMIKKTNGNTSRDDVAYALHLAAGARARSEVKPKREFRSLGVIR